LAGFGPIGGHDDGGLRRSGLDAPDDVERPAPAVPLRHKHGRPLAKGEVVLDDLARGGTLDDVAEHDASITDATGGMLRNDDVPRSGQLPDAGCHL
jgi:hypothetical protein